MWTAITHAQRTRLVALMPPHVALQFYLADSIALEDLVRIVEPMIVDAIVKLHCAHGKSVKQAVGKKKTLVDLLTAAQPQDLVVDLGSIVNAANAMYVSVACADTLREVKHRMERGGMLISTIKCKDTRLFWDSFCPKQSARKGSYTSMYASIKMCNEEFMKGGARRAFKIKFTAGSVKIGDNVVDLPNYLTWTGRDVAIESRRGIVFIDASGSAVFYGYVAAQMRPFMDCWNSDALGASEIIGKACSSCIWCGRELTDPTSVKKHAGPVCAPRYSKVLRHVQGPITGTTIHVPQTSPTKQVTLSTGVILNIPERLFASSPFLQGLVDTDAGDIDAATFLGVSSEALALLDEILADDEWLPDGFEELELALPIADKLGMDALTRRLETMYAKMCPSITHWSEWKDIKKRAEAKKVEMKAHGEVTPMVVKERVVKRKKSMW